MTLDKIIQTERGARHREEAITRLVQVFRPN